ncbi:hypothetical protein BG004_002580, partial [Podila humilis]
MQQTIEDKINAIARGLSNPQYFKETQPKYYDIDAYSVSCGKGSVDEGLEQEWARILIPRLKESGELVFQETATRLEKAWKAQKKGRQTRRFEEHMDSSLKKIVGKAKLQHRAITLDHFNRTLSKDLETYDPHPPPVAEHNASSNVSPNPIVQTEEAPLAHGNIQPSGSVDPGVGIGSGGAGSAFPASATSNKPVSRLLRGSSAEPGQPTASCDARHLGTLQSQVPKKRSQTREEDDSPDHLRGGKRTLVDGREGGVTIGMPTDRQDGQVQNEQALDLEQSSDRLDQDEVDELVTLIRSIKHKECTKWVLDGRCVSCMVDEYKELAVEALRARDLKKSEPADIMILAGTFAPWSPTTRMKKIFNTQFLRKLRDSLTKKLDAIDIEDSSIIRSIH